MDRHPAISQGAMNPPSEGKDRASAEGNSSSGNYADSFRYNPFSQQQRMAQVALQHRDPLSMMRDQQRNDNILAAAVQQQLVASLTSPSLFQFAGHSAHLGSDLFSRSTPNASFIQGLHNPSSSIGFPPGNVVMSKAEKSPETSSDKRSTTTQTPCQARGMATDHNSMSAYFEIASDAKHGQHLHCSHKVCRASGVKFRYCKYCKKPVTKQNFRSRHLHADLDTQKASTPKQLAGKKRTLEKQVYGLQEGEIRAKKGHNPTSYDPFAIRAKAKRTGVTSLGGKGDNSDVAVMLGVAAKATVPGDETALLGSSSSSSSVGRKKSVTQLLDGPVGPTISANSALVLAFANAAVGAGALERDGQEAALLLRGASSGGGGGQLGSSSIADSKSSLLETSDSTTKDAIQTVSRRRRWASLLSERPQSLNSGFDVWISKVVFVSDLSRSWQASGGADALGDDVVSPKNSVEQLSTWKSLLNERPSGMETGATISAWLSRVIEVSCMDYDPSTTSASGADDSDGNTSEETAASTPRDADTSNNSFPAQTTTLRPASREVQGDEIKDKDKTISLPAGAVLLAAAAVAASTKGSSDRNEESPANSAAGADRNAVLQNHPKNEDGTQ